MHAERLRLALSILSALSLLPGRAGAAEPAAAAAAPGLREVVATGLGATAEEARRDARRAAVDQAVGTYVDARTLVRDERVVDDQVLAVSEGFVESATDLGPPARRADGLVAVRVRAVVREDKLRHALAELRVVAVPPDTPEAVGREVERGVRADAAARMLARFLPTLRGGLLTARVLDGRGQETGEPAVDPVPGGGGDVALTWTVEVGYDRAAYDRAADKLRTLLDAVADRDASGRVTVETAGAIPWFGGTLQRRLYATGRPVRFALRHEAVRDSLPKAGRDEILVLVHGGGRPGQPRRTFHWYLLPRDPYAGLFAALDGPPAVEVTVLDEAGRRLGGDNGRLPLDRTLLEPDDADGGGGRAAGRRREPAVLELQNAAALGYRTSQLDWYLRAPEGAETVVVVAPEFVQSPPGADWNALPEAVVLRHTAVLTADEAKRARRLRVVSVGPDGAGRRRGG